MKKFLFLIIALFLASATRAADFCVDGLYYNIISETEHTVEVTESEGSKYEQTDVVIPSFITVDGSRYVVVCIGYNAFRDCSGLTSVTIPNSVTSIGYNAFRDCSGLTSVTIPDSVTSIGDGAFRDCSSLTSVTIPDSVTSIGYGAFLDCSSLTSVTIPASVTEIGVCSFLCKNLTEIKVEEGNKYFSSEDGVLYNIDKTKIIQCPGAKTEYIFPASVREIGEYAFADCSSLTSVTIPNSVTSIGENAFAGCSSLSSITIPNSVTSIGYGTFQNCRSLESVIIPKTIKKFAEFLFNNCKKLTKIVDLNPTPQTIGDDVFVGVPKTAVIYIPKGSFVAYMVANGWTQFTDFREMGAFDVSLSVSTLELPVGDSATISATVEKDSDVTVGASEWSSSDSAVATVDDGNVTAVAEGRAVIYYTVYDGYGVPHTESCVVKVTEGNAVESVSGDDSALVDVYTLNGVAIARNIYKTNLKTLPAGLYIVRQGATTRKIAVK